MTEEELRAIIAGTEGVTPGPWEIGLRGDYPASSLLSDDFTPIHSDTWGAFVSVVTDIDNGGGRVRTSEEGRANLAHIARCDPATIRAMAELALQALEMRKHYPAVGG